MYKVCDPGVPPRVNVNGTKSLLATSGTTRLNWYKPTYPGSQTVIQDSGLDGAKVDVKGR